MRIVRAFGIAIAASIVALLATLAMRVRAWRTGELPSAPLAFLPDGAGAAFPSRIWIDTDADLDSLADLGGAPARVAERARGWLDYWRRDIGREGFYPFDLLAAGYVIAPEPFRCARVTAWVGEDRRMFVPFLRPTALLVGQDRAAPVNARAASRARYCAETKNDLGDRLRGSLGARRDGEQPMPVSSREGGSR